MGSESMSAPLASKSISNPLVERLRDRNRIAGEGMFYAIPMLAAAAQEIERLQKQVTDMEAADTSRQPYDKGWQDGRRDAWIAFNAGSSAPETPAARKDVWADASNAYDRWHVGRPEPESEKGRSWKAGYVSALRDVEGPAPTTSGDKP